MELFVILSWLGPGPCIGIWLGPSKRKAGGEKGFYIKHYATEKCSHTKLQNKNKAIKYNTFKNAYPLALSRHLAEINKQAYFIKESEKSNKGLLLLQNKISRDC